MHPGVPAGGHVSDIQKQELGTSDLVVHGGKWKAGRHFPSKSAQTEGKMLAQPSAQEGRGHTGSSPQPEGQNKDRGETCWSLPGTQESLGPGLFVNVSLLKGKSPALREVLLSC